MPRKPKEPVVAERTEICKTCRHSEFAEQEFRCRRYAPIGVYDGLYVWPQVAADDFCGDFSAKLDS
jgi:hypothetical protein